MDEVLKPGMPAAIRVNFGALPVAAILSLSGLTVMNEKVYEKIREKSGAKISTNALTKKYVYDMFDQEYQVLGDVNMNVTIKEQVITVSVLVVKDILVDLILGRSFVNQIKPVFHFGLNLLKWDDKDRINVTHLVQDRESLAALTNEGSNRKIPEIIVAAFNFKQTIPTSAAGKPIETEESEEEVNMADRKCNLMVIRVHFGSLKVAAAITPQGISAMSDKVFQKIRDKSEVKITTYPKTDEYVYGYALNERVKVLETVVLEATIEDQIVPIPVLILENLSFDMVLGYDFVDGKKADIDWGGKRLWWRQGNRTYITPFIDIANKTLSAVTDEGKKTKSNGIIASVTLVRRPRQSQPFHVSPDEDEEMNLIRELNKLKAAGGRSKAAPKRKGNNKKSRKVR